MKSTKYAISRQDAGAFHHYISYIISLYGLDDVFYPLEGATTPKAWTARAPYEIFLDSEDQYGAVITVKPAIEEDNATAQRHFLRTIHAFNIWPQVVKE